MTKDFLIFYQSLPSLVSPIAVSVGSFSLYWYAACYLLGIVGAYGVFYFFAVRCDKKYTSAQVADIFLLVVLGAIVGARLGYVLFYNLPYYLAHPLAIISPLDPISGAWIGISGMSFHGGLIGVAAVLWLRARHSDALARRSHVNFWQFADYAAIAVPVGLFFGRIGNFLTGELYGRVTNVPWGMVFPHAGGGLTRHPSQLYEAFLEGVVLFVIIALMRRRTRFTGELALIFLIGYSVTRFIAEFFRAPDTQIGYIFGFFTMGQVLSLVVAACAILLYKHLCITPLPHTPQNRV